ncbi:hypothetical protein ACQB60_10415 [Actinomycetota bacterium Odt1-20B]
MSAFRRRATTFAAVGAGVLVLVGASATAAQSSTISTKASATARQASPRVSAGCTYPYACLYMGETETGRYKDITRGWQTLRASRGAEYIVNTRRDDGVRLHFTNGQTKCIKPLANAVHLTPYGTVDKLQITDSPRCAT